MIFKKVLFYLTLVAFARTWWEPPAVLLSTAFHARVATMNLYSLQYTNTLSCHKHNLYKTVYTTLYIFIYIIDYLINK